MTGIEAEVRAVAEALAALPGVSGVTLGGSRATGLADATSDYDLHVWLAGPAPETATRHTILRPHADDGAIREETAWGLEDHLRVGGALVELVYVRLEDLRATMDAAEAGEVTEEFFALASLHSLHAGVVLADDGTLAELKQRLLTYPEAARTRLVGDLPRIGAAYVTQLRTAQRRGDLPMATHRRDSVQLVWFNLLFAANRRYHPGEKRLLEHLERCPLRPAHDRERIEEAHHLDVLDPGLPELWQALLDDLSRACGPGPARGTP